MAVKTSFCYLWELNVEFILRFIAKNYIWRTLGSQTKTRKHQITSALDLWTTPRSQTWLRKQSQFKIFLFFGQKYSSFKISIVYYDLELSQVTVLLKFAFVFKYTFVSRGLTHYGRTIRFAALCGARHTQGASISKAIVTLTILSFCSLVKIVCWDGRFLSPIPARYYILDVCEPR